jgi:hypothetical protein
MSGTKAARTGALGTGTWAAALRRHHRFMLPNDSGRSDIALIPKGRHRSASQSWVNPPRRCRSGSGAGATSRTAALGEAIRRHAPAR